MNITLPYILHEPALPVTFWKSCPSTMKGQQHAAQQRQPPEQQSHSSDFHWPAGAMGLLSGGANAGREQSSVN